MGLFSFIKDAGAKIFGGSAKAALLHSSRLRIRTRIRGSLRAQTSQVK